MQRPSRLSALSFHMPNLYVQFHTVALNVLVSTIVSVRNSIIYVKPIPVRQKCVWRWSSTFWNLPITDGGVSLPLIVVDMHVSRKTVPYLTFFSSIGSIISEILVDILTTLNQIGVFD